MLRFPPVAAVVAALVLAAPAAAQTPGDTLDALTPGRRALSFALPYGGGVGLGVWRVVAPDRARGFFVNVSTTYNEETSNAPGGTDKRVSVSASVGPQFRRYLGRTAPVAPFLQSGLGLGMSYSWMRMNDPTFGQGEEQSWTGLASVSLGPGVEWFPVKRVSVSGQTGLSAAVSYGRDRASGSYFPDRTSHWSVGFGTFVSSLALQIYF